MAAKRKKPAVPGNLARTTISLRDAVLAGGAIVTAALVGGAAWNDITKDVKVLQSDVTEIRSHQKATTETLSEIVQLVKSRK